LVQLERQGGHPGSEEEQTSYIASGRSATGRIRATTPLQRPLADGLIADDDTARGEQFVHHPQAEQEAEVEPDGVADDLSRKAIGGVARKADGGILPG